MDAPRSILESKPSRAPVAQLDRANGFEPLGWGFKSLRARHFSRGSGPETWVTDRTGDSGYTFGPNGLVLPETWVACNLLPDVPKNTTDSPASWVWGRLDHALFE